MNQSEAFVYTYSAKDNAEIEQIRRKYLPQSESKLEELKRLNATVQKSGVVEALSAGIGGMLISYPTYRKTQNAKRKELAPRILELASKLAVNKAV